VAQGDSRGSQDNRRAEGGRRSDRDSNRNRRPDDRSGRGPRHSDRRGGYQGKRRDDDRRGGYQGKRRDDDRRGGYQGKRRDEDRRGGYQGKRRDDDRRDGYQGKRRDDDRRGGYQGKRRDDDRRGGRGRSDNDRRAPRKTDTGEYAREQRARRPRIQEPEIPEGVTGRELDKEIFGQLRSLDKENAAMVAKHLVAAGGLLDLDPDRAHEHAKAAMARAGRVAVVREALGIAAYYVEKYDEAVRELRTHRRISGSNDNLALIADAERGRGKPEKAIELLKNSDELDLDNDTRTELVIVAAGAKSDLDDLDGARKLIEAEDFTQKPSGGLVRLMAAYAEVLRLYGETELADKYEELSRRTAKATGTLFGDEEPDLNAGVEIETVEEIEDEPEPADDGPVEDAVSDDESEAAEVTAPTAEPADAAATAAEPAAEPTDAAPSTSSEAKSEPEPEAEPAAAVSASTTHISAKELKSVKVTDEEIEAELDEILADAEADGDQ
jgi:tetratricopeptide (TPR) repeat protein